VAVTTDDGHRLGFRFEVRTPESVSDRPALWQRVAVANAAYGAGSDWSNGISRC